MKKNYKSETILKTLRWFFEINHFKKNTWLFHLCRCLMTRNCAILHVKWRPCELSVPSWLVIMFTRYPWYPRGKVVKVGVCVTKLRHLEQICCQMLMITQQSWLYLIKISMSLGYQFWQGKKGQSIFSLLCFHEALELVEVSNSILAILFKNWLWSYKST